MYKISDFKIPYLILKLAANINNQDFVDLNIKFDPNSDVKIEDGVLILGERTSLQDTFWGLIQNYLNNFELIYGISPWSSQAQKIQTYSELNKFLLKLFNPIKKEKIGIEEPSVKRLYQNPLVWTILETVICPALNIRLENKQIVVSQSPFIDISSSFSEDDFSEIHQDLNYPFIFLNDDCIYEPIKFAHLLISAIESLGACPVKTINDIYNNKYLFNLLIGLAKNYFLDDEELNDFISHLLILVEIGMITIENIINKKDYKIAQALDPEALQGNWWYFGLYEKMLEPSRGPDQTIHRSLELLREEIKNKIEKVKNKKGRDGLTYEKLLRIKDEEVTSDNYKVIEKLLSSDRIW